MGRQTKAMLQAEVERLQEKVRRLLPRDPGDSALPVPRLQLRWETRHLCHYELVVPLGEHDIRRERGEEQTKGSRNYAIFLGCTERRGSDREPLLTKEDGSVEVDTPYRDGAHIRWDAVALNLPMYAIWREHATLLQPWPAPADG